MGIEVGFTKADIEARFNAFLDVVKEEQINALRYLGEKCVAHARAIPKEQGFEDQTGNLRSSIGYAVFVDGVAAHSSYEEVKGGAIGAKAGENLSKKIGELTNGICLVVTAGMSYALYVESKGRDVITSAEQLAERELPRMLEKLVDDLKKSAG